MNDFSGQSFDPTHAPLLPDERDQDLPHAVGLAISLLGPRDSGGEVISHLQPEQGNKKEPLMTESDLLAIVNAKLQQSHQWNDDGGGILSQNRILADKYYRGDLRGDEVEGCSRVVSRDVAEAIDSILPSLVRIFTGGDQVVVFRPNGPEDEDSAQQATDYINHIFMEENEGFLILLTWFKDALLKKNGIVKSWYDVRIKKTRERYHGLTQEQLDALKMDQSFEILEEESYNDVVMIVDPVTRQQVPQPISLFNCTLLLAKPERRIRIENVPPDEFIIERRTVSLQETGFVGHRCRRTVSDLVECGFDLEMLKALPDNTFIDNTQERQTRFEGEGAILSGELATNLDFSMKKVWVTEIYMKVDFDKDGVAEWRKITAIGDSSGQVTKILSNDETDDHAFSDLTPIPEPHKFFGQSLFDQTRDIQDIKTALIRGALDSIYLANKPRMGVVSEQVNLDDLQDVRAGGIVRLKNPAALVPIQTTLATPQALQMIEYIDSVREQRTGVTRYNQGLNADSLNKTATGMTMIQNAGQQRIEMIARIFAETGVKRLFRRIFKLTCQNEDVQKVMKLRNKWTTINPRDWKDRMDVSVSVGIGTGNKQQQTMIAMQMLDLDARIVQMQGGVNGPLLDAKNIYNKLAKLIEAIGWKTPEPYYMDPDVFEEKIRANPPPPPPPSSEQQKDLIALEIKNRELQMKEIDLEMKRLDAQIAAAQTIHKSPELLSGGQNG